MVFEAKELTTEVTVDTDLCIVGAGPAGITLAHELAGGHIRVCLLESGGMEPDEQTQQLAVGQTTGDCIQSPHTSRARALGGTSHLWNSRIAADRVGFRAGTLAAIDLEKKEWLPYSGWPLEIKDLAPFYERAQVICGLGPNRYEGAAWETENAVRLPLDEDILSTSVWQFAERNVFADLHRKSIATADNISTYLHANVVEIELNEAGDQVTRLRVRSLRGPSFWVKAKRYILAAGGIENARLLLNSDKKHKAGIGNDNDLVGRYFMEHQVVRSGTLYPYGPELFDRTALYDQRVDNHVPVLGKIDFTDEYLRKEKLMNVSAMLLPKYRWHDRVRQDSVDSLVALLRSARRGRLPADAGGHFKKVISGFDYVFASFCRKATGNRLFPYFIESPNLLSTGGWSNLDNKGRRFSFFEVLMHTEQAPDPENRITLSDERDELGCRRINLHWQWRDVDVENVKRAQELLAAEFERAGVGRLRIELKEGRPDMVISGLHHHMGTTRMSNEPKQGVVDPDGRVHGVANLFISGSSVFPTGGYINCTLTIVALAVRMADQIKVDWRSSEELRLMRGDDSERTTRSEFSAA